MRNGSDRASASHRKRGTRKQKTAATALAATAASYAPERRRLRATRQSGDGCELRARAARGQTDQGRGGGIETGGTGPVDSGGTWVAPEPPVPTVPPVLLVPPEPPPLDPGADGECLPPAPEEGGFSPPPVALAEPEAPPPE